MARQQKKEIPNKLFYSHLNIKGNINEQHATPDYGGGGGGYCISMINENA